MQEQNQPITEPQAQSAVTTPAKIVDIVAQSSPVEPSPAPVAAPDPELISEPAVEPAPAPAPADSTPAKPVAPVANQKHPAKQAEPKLAAPKQPKQPSNVPVGAITLAIVIFLILAAAALLAFQQGL